MDVFKSKLKDFARIKILIVTVWL